MIILSNRYDSYEIIKEEKYNWMTAVLNHLGAPKLENDSDHHLYREALNALAIEILTDTKGNVEIRKENELIGSWNEPKLTPKFDENNKIYYEIELVFNSVLDNRFDL